VKEFVRGGVASPSSEGPISSARGYEGTPLEEIFLPDVWKKEDYRRDLPLQGFLNY